MVSKYSTMASDIVSRPLVARIHRPFFRSAAGDFLHSGISQPRGETSSCHADGLVVVLVARADVIARRAGVWACAVRTIAGFGYSRHVIFVDGAGKYLFGSIRISVGAPAFADETSQKVPRASVSADSASC